MWHATDKRQFMTLTSTYLLLWSQDASNALSKDAKLFVQCPLKTKNKKWKTEFLWRDFIIQLFLVLQSTPFTAFREGLLLANNFRLILEETVRSILHKWRTEQLAKTLKIYKIHVFSFYNLKMKFHKDNVCVTTWIFLLHVLSDDLAFGT